ncbi:MAG: alpha/beta hydrolase [Rubripirellula sp.]
MRWLRNISGLFRILIAAVLVFVCAGQLPAQWVKPPSSEVLRQTRGLVHETMESDSMGTTVGYSVVLPPSYGSGDRRYPVVYWLHGGGGNECSSLYTAKYWDELYTTDSIQEIILVYPNGFRSGYMDHHNGKIMIESMIIQELIPRIDQQYRTIASRSCRAAHGFSMGASGSLKFAIKYPNLFCSAVAYGGGAIDIENTKMPFLLKILENNLASDPTLIRQNNTYHFLDQNLDTVRGNKIEILMVCGSDDSWKESAVAFQTALQMRNVPSQLRMVAGVGHDLKRLASAEGAAAAKFQDRIFGRSR